MTTDWFHTVKTVAPNSALAAAPTNARRWSPSSPHAIRCATRKKNPLAAAEVRAASRFTRTATDRPNGDSSTIHTRASTTKSGFPGGCGIPRMYPVAMYSLVSQNAVVGASVTTYSRRIAAPATTAAR